MYNENQPMPWVGLIGAAGSGKDTVANILAHGWAYKRVAFADPVRMSLLNLDPLVPVPAYEGTLMRVSKLVGNLGWEDAKRRSPEIRALLQRLGTDVVRSMAPDLWVDQALATATDVDLGGQTPVFTDTRFQNEVDMIRNHGGIIIRVVRTGSINEAAGHVSEQLHTTVDADRIIYNNSTLPLLADNVHYAINTIMEDQHV